MADLPSKRMFVGVLAYHWETKEKRLYAFDESCPFSDLASKGFRLYRFCTDLLWHDLAPAPHGPVTEVSPFEENETKDPLPQGVTLASFVYDKLSRVLYHLLPGRIFSPDHPVSTEFRRTTGEIILSTRYGKISLTIKDLP